tara:strand:+ start:6118 stop:7251 length:1134 start_codon:yes stop_codon:yes gene_type:complete
MAKKNPIQVVVFESISATPSTDVSYSNGYVSIVGANKTLKIRPDSILNKPTLTADVGFTAQQKTIEYTGALAAGEWTKLKTKRLDDNTVRTYTYVAPSAKTATEVATAVQALLEADNTAGTGSHFADSSGDGVSRSTATLTLVESADKSASADGLGKGGFTVEVTGYSAATIANTAVHVEPKGTLAEVQGYYPSAAQTNYDRWDFDYRDDAGTIQHARVYAYNNGTSNNFDILSPQMSDLASAGMGGGAMLIDAATTLDAGDSGGVYAIRESSAAHYTIQLPTVQAGLRYTFWWDAVDGTGDYDVTIAQSTSDTNDIVNVNIVAAGATETRIAADGVKFDSSAAPVRGDKLELWSDGTYWYGWAHTNAAAVCVAYSA